MPELTIEPFRPVWLASYPRSGNTFLRIILEEVFGIPTYSVYRVAGQTVSDPSAEVLKQAPFLPGDWRQRMSEDTQTPLFPIKTHDPPEGDAPAVYLVRDGRAAIHSYFYYHQKYAFEKPSLTDVIAGVCQFGSWSGHYLGWRPRNRARTLFIRYEDLVSSPVEVIPKLAAFLGVEPVGRRVPGFEELREKCPAFFRRGKNTDYLPEWTAGQMALFNQLHGSVMEELGYPLLPAVDPAGSAVIDLARSAARAHQLYLDELAKCGSAAVMQRQLSNEVNRLEKQVKELSAEIAWRDQALTNLLNKRWVRLGTTLRLLDHSGNRNGHEAAHDSDPA